jgi:hypothetical protein
MMTRRKMTFHPWRRNPLERRSLSLRTPSTVTLLRKEE